MISPKKRFDLSYKERTGALVLLTILFALLVVWRLLPSLVAPDIDPEEHQLQEAWAQFEKAQEVDTMAQPTRRNAAGTKTAGRLFLFDPNTVTEEKLKMLGLGHTTIKAWLKYRAKGGRFYKKEDVGKLYTLSRDDYQRIAPYIEIIAPAGLSVRKEEGLRYPIELNGAAEKELIALKGIGPVFARRIINFRDALGGFVTVTQLKEVYGLPDSTYQYLKDKFTLDVQLQKKIRLNSCNVDELAGHPYISRQLAARIIQFRNDLNGFDSITQLRQVPLINDEKYRKIAPYLSTH